LINIVDEFKQLYKQVGVLKETIIYFPSINLTIEKDRIIAESVKITESLCNSDNLKFGSCKSSQIEFTVINVDEDLKGLDFIVTQNIGEYTMPLGTYKADSCEKQDDLTHKKIIAYDSMTKLDIDVAPWYNDLFTLGTEVYTLAQFRTSFLTHFGLVEDTANLPLPNDTMTVTKTISPTQISGRVVSEAIEEINGSFGHIGRNEKFKHIVLKEMHTDYPQGDYPTNDYPEDDPYDENIYQSDYRKIIFEEYRVAPIDKLQIRQEENDTGCIVGTGTNAYVIQGNFLVYGKSAAELEIIANNVSINIFNRGYRPYTATQKGKPYLEVGDFAWYNADDSTAGYIFERTLTGIQALQDEFGAKGSEKQEQNFSAGLEIIQLKGRATTIEKSVEGVRIEVTDLDENTSTTFEQLYNQLVLKVDANGKIGIFKLSGDDEGTDILIKADNVILEGLITANGGFKILADGSTEQVNGKFSGQIISDSAIITGGSFNVTASGQYDTRIKLTYESTVSTLSPYGLILDIGTPTGHTEVRPGHIFIGNVTGVDNTEISYEGINTPSLTIGGHQPITDGNINSQSVSYASSAGSVSGLHSSSIIPDDTGSGNINFSGGLNAASPTWCDGRYVKISASDFRLKKNIQSLETLPDELFMSIKTKQYEFKTDTYNPGIRFGILAQELESAFQSFGLDPYAYNLIELADVIPYTDDGMYVDDKIHRINYDNFIPWSICMIQKLYSKVNGGV